VEYAHPRLSPRYPVVVDVELTDVQSQAQIRGGTKELSLFGCGVDTPQRFPQGATLRIKLSHRGAGIVAHGKVVYASPELGMGLAFTRIDPEDELILQGWIAELMSMPIQQH
jgi:hypothetical protein